MAKKLKPFSKREKEVLVLLAEGMLLKDIAKHIGKSQKTVSTYYLRIKKKASIPKTINMYCAVIMAYKHLKKTL